MPSGKEEPPTTKDDEKSSTSSSDNNEKKKDKPNFSSSKSSFALFGNHGSDSDSSNEDDESDQNVMNEKVLNQQDVDEDEQEKDTLEDARKPAGDDEDEKKQDETKIDIWKSVTKIMKGGGDKDESLDAVVDIVSTAIVSQSGELGDTESQLSASDFNAVIRRVLDQLEGNFEDVPIDKLDPLAFMYYLEDEDARKNPSWKRRLHRFMPSIKMETVYGLHNALYLSQLAYFDTVEDVKSGLDNYVGAKYELVYCTTEGQPRQPAHFIVIKREGTVPKAKPEKKQGNGDVFPSFMNKSYVEVVMVVRGTKTLEDMFSDAMLEASPYRDGLAHDGVCESGKYLVQKHTKLLLRILKMSGRDKVKLTMLGHSLGAGAAAVACIEFNDVDKIDATCIGFGCPALLDEKQSKEWKDKIITVINDSDCVTRMSGATAANLLMDLAEFEYKDFAMQDVTQYVNTVSKKASYLLPEDKKEETMKWFSDLLDNNAKPLSDLERREVVLFPPGKCIHFYRDGVGISAVEVPCAVFNELDVTRTMVEDHLLATGYAPILLETMRSHLRDFRFEFKNDVMSLRKAMKGGPGMDKEESNSDEENDDNIESFPEIHGMPCMSSSTSF